MARLMGLPQPPAVSAPSGAVFRAATCSIILWGFSPGPWRCWHTISVNNKHAAFRRWRFEPFARYPCDRGLGAYACAPASEAGAFFTGVVSERGEFSLV